MTVFLLNSQEEEEKKTRKNTLIRMNLRSRRKIKWIIQDNLHSLILVK